jgi:translation initiation factor 5A
MADDGETKDDVKVPEGEVGEKIEKLFTTEEKDTSEFATQSRMRRTFY